MDNFEKAPLKEGFEYAGFWIRSLARVIDILIFYILIFAIIYFLTFRIERISESISALVLFISFGLIFAPIEWLYLSWTTSQFGGTVGKLFSGLRVINDKGENLHFWKSIFRYTIGYTISKMFFGVGFYWITRDKNKQGWHDSVSDTYVIKPIESGMNVLMGVLVIIVQVIVIFFIIAGIVNNTYRFGKLMKDFERAGVIIGEFFSEQPYNKLENELDVPNSSEDKFLKNKYNYNYEFNYDENFNGADLKETEDITPEEFQQLFEEFEDNFEGFDTEEIPGGRNNYYEYNTQPSKNESNTL